MLCHCLLPLELLPTDAEVAHISDACLDHPTLLPNEADIAHLQRCHVELHFSAHSECSSQTFVLQKCLSSEFFQLSQLRCHDFATIEFLIRRRVIYGTHDLQRNLMFSFCWPARQQEQIPEKLLRHMQQLVVLWSHSILPMS